MTCAEERVVSCEEEEEEETDCEEDRCVDESAAAYICITHSKTNAYM